MEGMKEAKAIMKSSLMWNNNNHKNIEWKKLSSVIHEWMQSTWTWSDDKIIYLDYCSYEASKAFIRESVMLQLIIHQLY